MQLVQDREGPPPGAHFLHRGLVELAPLDRELHRVDVADPSFLEECTGLARNAGPPIDRGAEYVEHAGADIRRVHWINSFATIACTPLLPSTSCVTCRSQARLQNT